MAEKPERKPTKAVAGWAEKRPGKKTRRSTCKALTRKQALRRRQVADLANRGLHRSEIAHELGVDKTTIGSDLAAIERGWHEHTMRDWTAFRAREIAKLEMARDAAWLAYKTGENRHGETNLSGYLTAYLKACDLLQKLQQLNDPATQINLSVSGEQQNIQLQFIEVRNRDELADFQRFEALTAERYQALVERTLEP